MEGYDHKIFFTKEKNTERIPEEPIKPAKDLPRDFAERLAAEAANRQRKAEERKKNLMAQQRNFVPKKLTSLSHVPSAILPLEEKTQKAANDGKKKLTWQGLGNISYKDIKGNEGFNPESLVAGNDDDNEYLQILNQFSKGSESAKNRKPGRYSKISPEIIAKGIGNKGSYTINPMKHAQNSSNPDEYLESLMKGGIFYFL